MRGALVDVDVRMPRRASTLIVGGQKRYLYISTVGVCSAAASLLRQGDSRGSSQRSLSASARPAGKGTGKKGGARVMSASDRLGDDLAFAVERELIGERDVVEAGVAKSSCSAKRRRISCPSRS